MFLFDLFRSFIPRQNPIGFGAADFVEFVWLALVFAGVLLWRPFIEPAVRRWAPRTIPCMAFLFALPIALRSLLLTNHPVPAPQVYDEASHLLVADTLSHFRMANPPNADPQFFETAFTLQDPKYASIYPLGQGALLELGRAIFNSYWIAVILATALFCALCYWMLRAYVSPEWALAGGLLAVIEFGPLCYWMSSYWGGSLAGCAGCLVFGSLPRLRSSWRAGDAVLLGAGLGIHWLARPYETFFLCAGVMLFFAPLAKALPSAWRPLGRAALIATLAALPAIGATLAQDRAVTGQWFKTPEMLSQEQYGIPAALTFMADPVPHRVLTADQEDEYRIQMLFKGAKTETVENYMRRLRDNAHYYRFFFLPPVYLALPLVFTALGEWTIAWTVLTLAIFALGTNFFPAFQYHYLGGVACLLLLVGIVALRQLSRFAPRGLPAGAAAAGLLAAMCGAHFLFWYDAHLLESSEPVRELLPHEASMGWWMSIDQVHPNKHESVRARLAGIPGKQLVFVHYYRPRHLFEDEFVYNEADISGARIVWARDLGGAENEKLMRSYSDRKVWLLEPEFRPPRLREYATPIGVGATAPGLARPTSDTPRAVLPFPAAPAKTH